MNLGRAGLLEIESSEGFSSTPYWDAIGGVWTRGFGRTFGITQHSPAITRAQGERELIDEFDKRYAGALQPFIHMAGWNQNRFDALGSFIWNCGPTVVGPATTVGRELRAGNWVAAGNAMLAWCKDGNGRVIEGLRLRRIRERDLLLKPTGHGDDFYLTPQEHRVVNILQDERRTAARHGGWSKVAPQHLKAAAAAKKWLKERVAVLEHLDGSSNNRTQRIRALKSAIG